MEQSAALRNAIDVHLRAQNCVQIFNQAFGPLLVIFIVQVFIMICVLFFTIVKTPLTTAVDALVFFGNGTQYFIRALIGLYIFGRVQGESKNPWSWSELGSIFSAQFILFLTCFSVV